MKQCSNEEIINSIHSFAELSSTIKEQWDSLYEEIHNADLVQCDILHEIENSEKLGTVEGYKLYKQLKEIRNHRRDLKNRQALIEPLYKWYQNNKTIGINLFKVKTTMESIKTSQENWVYNPKIGVEVK